VRWSGAKWMGYTGERGRRRVDSVGKNSRRLCSAPGVRVRQERGRQDQGEDGQEASSAWPCDCERETGTGSWRVMRGRVVRLAVVAGGQHHHALVVSTLVTMIRCREKSVDRACPRTTRGILLPFPAGATRLKRMPPIRVSLCSARTHAMKANDHGFCESRCPVCTNARKGHRLARILQKIELAVTFGGCPAGRARRRKFGVRPDEPIPVTGRDDEVGASPE